MFCWQDIRGVLAANVAEENDAKWYTYVAEKHAPDVGSSLPSYIEAQVLGPVHLVDVERLYFPCHDLLDPWFMTVLRSLAEKYEFELVHY